MKYVIRILSDFCMNQARENGNNSYSNYIYYRTNLFITNTLHIRIILGKLNNIIHMRRGSGEPRFPLYKYKDYSRETRFPLYKRGGVRGNLGSPPL